MKTVNLFAIHRTGTNYLGSVLQQWPTLAAFGEIFHGKQVYGLKPAHLRALSNAAGREFTDAKDPEFIAWARSHPADVLERLERVAKRQDKAGVYFKVFVGQWTQGTEVVIPELARRPGYVPVILQRRCIDVYVSFRKAETAGLYKHVDTTDAPESLDPAAYARWANSARRWYAGVAASLAEAGATPLMATYEQDIDMPPDALSSHWAKLLGIAAPAALDQSIALARQDRSQSLESKIANYAGFMAGLRELGLHDEALGYFLDPLGVKSGV